MILDLKKTTLPRNNNSSPKSKLKNRKFIIKFILGIFIILFLVFFTKHYLDLRKTLSYKMSIIQQQTESDKRKYEEIQRLKEELESEKEEDKEKDANKEAAKEEEATSPEAYIDKASVSIRVLNGNGVYHAAADFSDILKKTGYTNVIGVADADNYEYKDITIKYPKAKKAEAEVLKVDLEEKYGVEFLELGNVADSSIIVIVGK